MQNINKYNLRELVDKSKRIVIVNNYNNSVLFDGKYEDIPAYLLDSDMKIFTPYEDRFEFII